MSMEAAEWYVVATKRFREPVAQKFLEQRGLRTYLPRIQQWPRPMVGAAVTPMFPGYVFVCCSAEREFYQAAVTPCVKEFVCFGGRPASLDARVLDFLREREDRDGIIRDDIAMMQNREVEIVQGPFRGLTAVMVQRLEARDRVRVLLHLLQRDVTVDVPERWVRQA